MFQSCCCSCNICSVIKHKRSEAFLCLPVHLQQLKQGEKKNDIWIMMYLEERTVWRFLFARRCFYGLFCWMCFLNVAFGLFWLPSIALLISTLQKPTIGLTWTALIRQLISGFLLQRGKSLSILTFFSKNLLCTWKQLDVKGPDWSECGLCVESNGLWRRKEPRNHL